MIIIQTAYPCVECKKEIDPTDAYCSGCGTQQPALEGRIVYNIFSRRGNDGPFNMLYGGLILEKDDIQELASDRGFGEKTEYFAASYILTDVKNNNGFSVTSWFPVKDGQLGEDLGPQNIQITSLE